MPVKIVKCKHNEGPQHDCAYVDRLDALVPEAARHADAIIGPQPVGDKNEVHAYFNMWNREFHAQMDRLAALAGVRGKVQS